MKLRQKLYSFMYGRYGQDSFGRFLTAVAIALTVFSILFRSMLAYTLMVLLLFWITFRMLSKNTSARTRENDVYKRSSAAFLRFFKQQYNRIRYAKTHVYRKCPCCKAMLKLRRVKGVHGVCCPKCGTSFDVRI